MTISKTRSADSNKQPTDPLSYQSGFGNEFESEALVGALPIGSFSPQKVPYGLYAEKFTSTAFTAPKHSNRRNWFYRISPSVKQSDFQKIDRKLIRNAADTIATPPNQMRWNPYEIPDEPTDFIDGLITVASSGSAAMLSGMGVHIYVANKSMSRYFYSADGEFLIVPQLGTLHIHTECGKLQVSPGEICVIPKGIKYKVELLDENARGYICENYGRAFELPERGPVGSDGFANDRDFMAPVAAYEDLTGNFELVCKFAGHLYNCELDHSPLDVVAWVGNSVPYKYDLARFNTMGTVSYDHPDPSIYTVLTSPSNTPGVAAVDFVIFPPRWMVAENTFRPPWYHRNVMSEFMGLVTGLYDAKEHGFVPGGSSLHNAMTAHGPEADVFEKATNVAELVPEKYADTLAIMFESCYMIQPTEYALNNDYLQHDYLDNWKSLKRNFNPNQP